MQIHLNSKNDETIEISQLISHNYICKFLKQFNDCILSTKSHELKMKMKKEVNITLSTNFEN